MGKPLSFPVGASFKSIVSKCGSLDEDQEDTTIEARLKSMAGPIQPAMNPTETATNTREITKVERHPNDDPNWNGPVKDA